MRRPRGHSRTPSAARASTSRSTSSEGIWRPLRRSSTATPTAQNALWCLFVSVGFEVGGNTKEAERWRTRTAELLAQGHAAEKPMADLLRQGRSPRSRGPQRYLPELVGRAPPPSSSPLAARCPRHRARPPRPRRALQPRRRVPPPLPPPHYRGDEEEVRASEGGARGPAGRPPNMSS